MEHTQCSVSWNSYTKNICHGLSSLQQRGEFVDMTLAADGHLVRVHKMVLSLISPYIKELITSTGCAHPVIFLNQISYETLCQILEYAYTGEVTVPNTNMKEFIRAGQALHIKGLNDSSFNLQQDTTTKNDNYGSVMSDEFNKSQYLETEELDSEEIEQDERVCESSEDEIIDNYEDKEGDHSYIETTLRTSKQRTNPVKSTAVKPVIQFTVSNHGNLQLILNRCLYNLRYTTRNGNNRRWQCVDALDKGVKCSATVVTKNNTIVRRRGVHNHPYHDAKILKKVQSDTIFTAVQDAVLKGTLLQKDRHGTSKTQRGASNED